MKTSILLFITLFVIVSCIQPTEQNSKTIITGTVSNFQDVSNYNTIEIFIEDLFGEKQILGSIDKNGNFRFDFELIHPTDFSLKYSGYLSFFVSPGDSLHFDIDGKCWSEVSETHSEEYQYYKVTGTAEKINSEIIKFFSTANSVFNWGKINKAAKILDALEFKSFMKDQLEYNYHVLDSFSSAENSSAQFRNYMHNYIKYNNWIDLLSYRWAHVYGTDENPMEYVHKMPKEYFDFLNTMKNERSDAFQTKNYFIFLQEYCRYIDQIVPLDTQKFYRQTIEDNFEKGVIFLLKHYSQVTKGFLKDIVISKFYYRLLDAKYYDQIKNIFNAQLIEDEQLRTRLQQKFEYEKKLFENPQFAAGSKINELKNANDYLQALIKKYPDKVLYLDFWAPWCAPCINEMPFAKKIHTKFDGKDVVFVFLANRCKKKAWESTIAEKKIEGEHYFLTNKQFAQLSEIFGIKGIPHYVLIGKNGNIVTKNAPRPSSGDKLICLINDNL